MKRFNREGWRRKYPDEDADKYFARIGRIKQNAAQELWLQITLTSGGDVLLSITQLSAAELAARNLEQGLNNFYSGYTRGPYTTKLRDVALVRADSPLLSYPYAVMDCEQSGVIAGSQEECKAWADEMNVLYAKKIMVKP